MLSTLHLPVANAVVNPAAAAASAAAAKRLHRQSRKRFSATRGVGGKKRQKQTNDEAVEVATPNAFINMSDLDETEGITNEPEQGDTVKDDKKPSDVCEINAMVSWQRLPPRRVKLLLEGKKEGVMGKLTIRKGNTRVRRMRWLNQPAKQF